MNTSMSYAKQFGFPLVFRMKRRVLLFAIFLLLGIGNVWAAITVTKVGTDTVVTVTGEMRIPALSSDSIVYVDFADVFSVTQSKSGGGLSIPASTSLISLIDGDGAAIRDFGVYRYWTDYGTGLRLALVGDTSDIAGRYIQIRSGTMVFAGDAGFGQPDLSFESVQLINGKGGPSSDFSPISAVTVPEPNSTLLAGLAAVFIASLRIVRRR
jgi:hypothetical protein